MTSDTVVVPVSIIIHYNFILKHFFIIIIMMLCVFLYLFNFIRI